MIMVQQLRKKNGDVGSDNVVYWMFLIVGLLPMLYAVIRGEIWGVMPSLGLLMFGVALFGFVQLIRPRMKSRKKDE
jgi:hypothetical protein